MEEGGKGPGGVVDGRGRWRGGGSGRAAGQVTGGEDGVIGYLGIFRACCEVGESGKSSFAFSRKF